MELDPFSEAWQRDPYPMYRRLRDEAPVFHHARSNTWLVTRYEDVQYVFRHPELFSSDTRATNRMRAARESARTRVSMLWKVAVGLRLNPFRIAQFRMLILDDPPTHGPMRNLVNRGFTPRRIARWEGRIRELVEKSMAQMRGLERFDLVSELAIPLPVTVISELLGIPAEDRHLFKRWSDELVEDNTGPDGAGTTASFEVMFELVRYMRPIIRQRRRHPADDLISVIAAASEGELGLTEFEIAMFILLLLVAGNETTTNLLGNTVDALLEHPDQLARVAADLSLVPALVEEALRYDSPVQRLRRVVREDTEIAGVKIPAEGDLLIAIGSANRDERRFPEPDRFDIDRDTRGHLAFGFGNHFCLGASLARLEARVALEALVPELPRLARAAPEREFLSSFVIRGRRRLELREAA